MDEFVEVLAGDAAEQGGGGDVQEGAVFGENLPEFLGGGDAIQDFQLARLNDNCLLRPSENL